MGHSYVSYGERHEHMHDAEILTAASYVVDFARQHPGEFSVETLPCLPVWASLAEVHGPGCVDLQLDECVVGASAQREFWRLISAARAALSAEPDMIEGSRLTAMVDAPAVLRFGDRPRAKMLADLDRLASVVPQP